MPMLTHAGIAEYIVRVGVEYVASSHGFALREETWQWSRLMPGYYERGGKQKNTSLFRYRDSPEEIQGGC
jgi:hypothetical protein